MEDKAKLEKLDSQASLDLVVAAETALEEKQDSRTSQAVNLNTEGIDADSTTCRFDVSSSKTEEVESGITHDGSTDLPDKASHISDASPKPSGTNEVDNPWASALLRKHKSRFTRNRKFTLSGSRTGIPLMVVNKNAKEPSPLSKPTNLQKSPKEEEEIVVSPRVPVKVEPESLPVKASPSSSEPALVPVSITTSKGSKCVLFCPKARLRLTYFFEILTNAKVTCF